MLLPELKDKIKKIFLDFLKLKQKEYKNLFNWEEYQAEHPLTTALNYKKDFWRSARLVKNFETATGKLYQKIAKEIAISKFGEAYNEYTIDITLDSKIFEKIDSIVSELREKRDSNTKKFKRLPNWEREVNEIKKVKDSIKNVNKISKSIALDLYIPNFKGLDEKNFLPFYVEMKSPKPNLNECERIKRDLLIAEFSEIWQKRGGNHIYYAMTYNPYKTRENYAWSPVKKFFDINGHKLLMGKEFWDLIGGEGTYFKILELAKLASKDVNILNFIDSILTQKKLNNF